MSTKTYFIFDVESIGLHGEGFAVGGGVYNWYGASHEFLFSCPRESAEGNNADRNWVNSNVPEIAATHKTPKEVRDAFWKEWENAKSFYPGILMAGECLWPVEANFLAAAVKDSPAERNWMGPYPFYEISSIMAVAGMDVMKKYERTGWEMPEHNPLNDARLSARLLFTALFELKYLAKGS